MINKFLSLFKPKVPQIITKFPKLLYSPQHQFITYPKNRISYLGISDYAKRCLVPDAIKIEPTLNVNVRQSVLYFQGNLLSTDDDPLSLLDNIPQNLIIRKGDYLITIETKDADWALIAPVDLRVIKINSSSFDQCVPLSIFKWILKIQVIDQKQLQQLLTPDEYQKLWKIISHQ